MPCVTEREIVTNRLCKSRAHVKACACIAGVLRSLYFTKYSLVQTSLHQNATDCVEIKSKKRVSTYTAHARTDFTVLLDARKLFPVLCSLVHNHRRLRGTASMIKATGCLHICCCESRTS
jgi:hypothetical protein